jgi:esterase/lipase
MTHDWLVFGGWSMPPEMLSSIFGNNAVYIDVNTLFVEILQEEKIIDNWDNVVLDKIKGFLKSPIVNIAGWSTGAFFAYTLCARLNPKHLVLLSATPSFCKRDDFAFGQNPTVLKLMRKQLKRSKLSVLKDFQIQCGCKEYSPLAERYSQQELIAGLQYLENICLFPLHKPPCAVQLFHGKEDAIIPYEAAEFLAQELGVAKTILSGGHTFFLDDEAAALIRTEINE